MKNKKGFTIIELIATIVIIIILSSTAIVGVTRSKNNANKKYCENNGDMFVVAGKDYFNDNKTKLPDEIGEEECVNLGTLLNEKYIDDEMVDYEDTKCDNNTSRVCVIRKTKSDFYYRKELNCGKCNEVDEQVSRKDSTMTITYTPNGGKNSNNKDINVTVKLANTGADIISYKYTIYKREGSSAVKVKGIEYKEYKNKDIKIKLEEEGTFYIETTAINEYGDKKTEISKDYVLNYSLEAGCGNQISIYARSKGNKKVADTANLSEKVWYKGDFTFFVDKKGAIKSFDVYLKKSEDSNYIRLITRSTNDKKLTYNADKVLDNKQYQTSNISSEPKGYIGRTDTYSIYVVGYDEKGESCETRKYTYYQDNTDPTCKTISKTSEAGYHFGNNADYPQSKWVNQNVVLNGECADTLREPGRVNSTCKGNVANRINVLSNQYYNGTPSAGDVYDQAGNTIRCPLENVRIDKIPPTAGYVTVTSGIAGNNGWWLSALALGPINGSDGQSGHETTWVSPTAIVQEGVNLLSIATTRDIAGNTSNRNGYFNIDYTAPTCTTSGGSWSWVKTRQTTIRGTCRDNLSGCTQGRGSGKLSRDGVTDDCVANDFAGLKRRYDASGNISLMIPYDWSAMGNPGPLCDRAGNYAQCGYKEPVKRDTNPPICTSSGGGTFSGPTTISCSCYDPTEPTQIKELGLSSGCAGSCSASMNVSSSGTYSPGKVCDNVGNCIQCPNVSVTINPPASKHTCYASADIHVEVDSCDDCTVAHNGSGGWCD